LPKTIFLSLYLVLMLYLPPTFITLKFILYLNMEHIQYIHKKLKLIELASHFV
jgi:hypothetical protein